MKGKAEKKFARQFGASGAAASAASGQAGPRAAVYKGKMGARHKRAARMQGGGPSSFASSALGFLSSLPVKRPSPRVLAVASVAVCLVLSGVLLYPDAQRCYRSVRDLDQKQAEYAAVEARNETMQEDVNALSTDAGIEDRARREFGWVKDGEQSANVSGLSGEGGDGDSFSAPVQPGSVAAPETWYSKLLDPLFGIE